jgi:hypothetical protein
MLVGAEFGLSYSEVDFPTKPQLAKAVQLDIIRMLVSIF